jgi:hypothetical protein
MENINYFDAKFNAIKYWINLKISLKVDYILSKKKVKGKNKPIKINGFDSFWKHNKEKFTNPFNNL